MTSLQATKDFFFNRTAIGRQRLGSDDNKVEGNYHSDVSDTSRDNLEGAFSSLDKIKKPGWVRRIIEYGRRRKTTFADWSSAQPRSVWASVILAVLATVVIL